MTPVVECHGVSRTYPGIVPVHALGDVSFSIEDGELAAIVGPSGSGKSTLLGILGCLDLPSSGTARIAGQDITCLGDAGRSRLRRDVIGFVFQQFHLIPYLSAVKNVESALLYRGLSARERRARALAALDRVGLAARAHHRPMFLSGGEQQRVAIARAIVSDPALILADEPTGSLDSANAAVVLELLRSIAATGAAVVIVTHDEAIAAHASRQLVMLDGRLQHDSRRSAAA